MSGPEASFWEHLDELRLLLIRCIVIVCVGFALAFIFRETVLDLLTWPAQQVACTTCTPSVQRTPLVAERLTNHGQATVSVPIRGGVITLGPGESRDLLEPPAAQHGLVLFSPAEGFSTTLTVCFWTGLTATSPLWLALICAYIAPALRLGGERRILQFVAVSTLFMGVGSYFALAVTIPTANRFFHQFNQGLGVDLWSLGQYLHYTLFLMLASALAFEVAALAFFLVHLGRVSVGTLTKHRRMALLLIVTACAVLTPPDVVSQLLLAAPMILLYEGTVLYARLRQ